MWSACAQCLSDHDLRCSIVGLASCRHPRWRHLSMCWHQVSLFRLVLLNARLQVSLFRGSVSPLIIPPALRPCGPSENVTRAPTCAHWWITIPSPLAAVRSPLIALWLSTRRPLPVLIHLRLFPPSPVHRRCRPHFAHSGRCARVILACDRSSFVDCRPISAPSLSAHWRAICRSPLF